MGLHLHAQPVGAAASPPGPTRNVQPFPLDVPLFGLKPPSAVALTDHSRLLPKPHLDAFR